MSETHQGYTNYATFGVAVTLDNDREMYETVNDMTAGAKRADKPEVAESIRSYVEGLIDDAEGMTAALVMAGLAEVDWDDIAEQHIPSEYVESFDD